MFQISSTNLTFSCGNAQNRSSQQQHLALSNYKHYLKQLPYPAIQIYTDASVTQSSSNCGCGISIFTSHQKLTIQFLIHNSIIAGETFAVATSFLICKWLNLNLPVYCFTDSLNTFTSSFNSIRARTSHPSLIQFIKTCLLFSDFHLIKIASHVQIVPNDEVDQLAKQARLLPNVLNANSLIELRQSILFHFKRFYSNIPLQIPVQCPTRFPSFNTQSKFSFFQILPHDLTPKDYFFFTSTPFPRSGIG